MNLADIREKAQQEKNRTDQPEPAIITPPNDQQHDMSVETTGEEATGTVRSHLPSVLAGKVQPSFDPLAVLLEGRSVSGCDPNALIDDLAPEEAVVEDLREFLCFRVSDELYAINIMEIKEIIKPREVTEVPRVPSFISGVLSLRGIIIPVFNMHERLGLTGNGNTGKERVIVVKNGEEFSGIVVDEVIQVGRIAEGTIEPPPAVLDGIDRDFVQGVGRFEGNMLILLNLKNILDLSLM